MTKSRFDFSLTLETLNFSLLWFIERSEVPKNILVTKVVHNCHTNG